MFQERSAWGTLMKISACTQLLSLDNVRRFMRDYDRLSVVDGEDCARRCVECHEQRSWDVLLADAKDFLANVREYVRGNLVLQEGEMRQELLLEEQKERIQMCLPIGCAQCWSEHSVRQATMMLGARANERVEEFAVAQLFGLDSRVSHDQLQEKYDQFCNLHRACDSPDSGKTVQQKRPWEFVDAAYQRIRERLRAVEQLKQIKREQEKAIAALSSEEPSGCIDGSARLLDICYRSRWPRKQTLEWLQRTLQ